MSSPTQTSTILFLFREHGNFYVRFKSDIDSQETTGLITQDLDKAFEWAQTIKSNTSNLIFL